MNFAFPAFLFALSAISIPIIIHLFNLRRYKKVYFSNVRFLKAINEETQKRAKLKHLLILACRILAIAFLVLAFCQPFIPNANSKIKMGDNAVSIFIDNSFSMETVNKNGSLFEDAKKRAVEIINAFAQSDRFQIFTNDFEGRHQRLLSKEEALTAIDELQITASSHKLSEIATRAVDALSKSSAVKKKLYIISDFQKSVTDIENINNDSTISTTLVPLTSQVSNNIYIDTCWFESPIHQLGNTEKLFVKIINASDKDVENSSIKLFVNDVQKSPSSFSITANSNKTIEIAFTIKETGINQCYLSLEDFPVNFDDTYYFSFTVASHISVLSIEGNEITNGKKSNHIKSLFSDSVFKLTRVEETKLDFSSFNKNTLIVLNQLKAISSGMAQELKKYINNGGSLLIVPSSDIELNSYNNFTSMLQVPSFEKPDTNRTKVDKINFEHPIYSGVFEKTNKDFDLPKIIKQYKITRNINSAEDFLMRCENGSTFLSAYKQKKGTVFLLSVPLDDAFSNFQRHALFVPTLYKIAFNSTYNQPLYKIIGSDEIVELTNIDLVKDNVFHITDKNSVDIIPEYKTFENNTLLYFHSQLSKSGNYQIKNTDSIIAPLSLNYNKIESDLSVFNIDELNSKISESGYKNMVTIKTGEKSVHEIIKEYDKGTQLWKQCIILALIFLGAEITLIRILK